MKKKKDESSKGGSLLDTLKSLNKEYGEGTIDVYENMGSIKVDTISTGSLGLDVALGGGYPKGRIVELYGLESSGKTTLALHAIAEVQRAGGVAAFIDAEHALDPANAESLGVDMDKLILTQPNCGEDALNIAEKLCATGEVAIVVIDSVAALTPKAEIDGEVGDHFVGLQARMMSQALRKLASAVNNTDTILIFINQIRMKIGVMYGCFQYNTRVVLADGTTKKIGTIVNQKLPVNVMSFDPETGKVSPRRVVNWFNNGKADHFLQFTVEKQGGNGRSQFAVTPNHTLFTPDGEMSAGDVKVGDYLLARSPNDTMVPMEVKDIYVKPPTRSMQKFDLEVEGNHTYLVDGIGAHNSPETTTGGQALKFYSSQRIEVRRKEVLKDGDSSYGIRVGCKVVKNKVAPPFRTCEFPLIFGRGIDRMDEVINAAILGKFLEKAGSWIKLDGESIGQGMSGAVTYFKENPDKYAILYDQVKASLGM